MKQTGRTRWKVDGHGLQFTNEALVFDFFEHAMAAVVLLHTALDNLLNEMLPVDFKYTSEKGEEWDRERIERSIGLERRLTEVAAAATGRPDIRTGRPVRLPFANSLKGLRDDLGHANGETGRASLRERR